MSTSIGTDASSHLMKLEECKKFLEGRTPYDTIGLESKEVLNYIASSLGSISQSFSGFVRSWIPRSNKDKDSAFYGKAPALTLAFPGYDLALARKVNTILDGIPYSSLQHFTIRNPEGLTGPMLPYVIAITNAVNAMADVDTRILMPLNRWVGMALAEKDIPSKVWLQDRYAASIDLDKLPKVLSRYWNDNHGSDLVMRPIHKVYPLREDIGKAGNVLSDAQVTASKIAAAGLSKKAEEVSKNISLLVEENDRNNILQGASNKNIAQLAGMVYEAARELEYLSILVFQVKVCMTAYNDTLSRISEKVK